MRETGVERLQSIELHLNRQDYIVMRYLIADLKNAIQNYSAGSVLDIGCGNKPYQNLFSNRITSYTGCDVVQSSLNCVDVICPSTALAFNDESFDTVFTTQVIEHVEDPFKMIAEAKRVLKSNGVIILSAPFTWELHEEPYDFYRYTKYGLEHMLKEAGFSVVQIKANGGKWAALVQMNINIIYSSFNQKGIFNKILKGLFINLRFTSLLNRLGRWLDTKYHDELLTLNYVVVARKN